MTILGRILANTGGWATSLPVGSPITILGSSSGSNGRYTIVGFSVFGDPVVGHRATKAMCYATTTPAAALDLQMREDREQQQVWFKLVNTTAVQATVALSLSLAGGTADAAVLTQGVGTLTVTSGTTASVSLTAAAGGVAEGFIHLTAATSSTVFTLTLTSGTLTGARLGNLGVFPVSVGGATSWASAAIWAWGGFVWTGLRSGADDPTLTVLDHGHPGWYLGLSNPGTIEEDAYTVTSPDEMVVVEVDHRNHRNYSDTDVKTLVREVLLPAHVDSILGLV